ncbi:hypothetical protein IFM89_006002 [Coptis chinensis]|uniref:RNase H type-1 domain-containing protein n=1 Tax=Coptis chinensis TaxID=261450 RepID=A0A835I7X3_9MAGN|nr:hypothetical protein IFM89_006002 [Coptis chinensis]
MKDYKNSTTVFQFPFLPTISDGSGVYVNTKNVWYDNPALRDWLKEHSDDSNLDKLKWTYYSINKSPWSSLDDNEAFLTTADSAVKLLAKSTKTVPGWKGLEYKVAFPILKPPGANFYPPDMDKKEFELWKSSLKDDECQAATGFFDVIKRHSETSLDASMDSATHGSGDKVVSSINDLYSLPYSQEYKHFLTKAAELLSKAGDLTDSLSLKRFLRKRADAFLSNDYYDSDIAWMELDSKLDVTIGPYETYEDTLFGYKATFEAFIGIRDDDATTKIKLFGDYLQVLEQNLPLDDSFKSKDVVAAPIRVIQLVYNAGDVKGPQTVAFNLPNDEHIVNKRGTSMVMLKNVSEAKFKLILQPIAGLCITEEQRKHVDFESFFTHTICHECCHGIGPHTITLPGGQKSTVRLELQELHSALEEAKADIVGLWALKFFVKQGLPIVGRFKLIINGALNGIGNGHCGVIRDFHGQVVMAFSGTGGSETAIFHELKAIDQGLIICLNMSLKGIEVASDFLRAVQSVNKIEKPPWFCEDSVVSISKLYCQFTYISIVHEFREANKAADYLASLVVM